MYYVVTCELSVYVHCLGFRVHPFHFCMFWLALFQLLHASTWFCEIAFLCVVVVLPSVCVWRSLCFRKMFAGRSLHRFFARLPTSESSCGSGRLHGCDNSESVVPCGPETSGKSGRLSVCNVPRQRREDRQAKKRGRSNPAVVLFNPEDPSAQCYGNS